MPEKEKGKDEDEEEDEEAKTRFTWKYWLVAAVYIVITCTLFIAKTFFKWAIDSKSITLFAMIWIPIILPFVRRLKFKDLEIEFLERRVKQVQAEISTIANNTEIAQDAIRGVVKVDPKRIRLRYTSERVDERYYRVRVWLEAPGDFLSQVSKVVYERHPTFTRRFFEATVAPFEDNFKCWGEFTIKAAIKLKSGETLRRQKYLALSSGTAVTEADEEI